MIDWLTSHNAAVVAIAAAVSAIATVAIAALTAGTFALYQLEKKREQGQTGVLAGHLVRLQNHFRTSADLMDDVMKRDPMFTGVGKDTARFILQENSRRRPHIEDLLDRAASTKMEVSAALDTTLVLMHGIDGIAEHIVKTSGGSRDLENAGKQMAVELRDIAEALERGYNSLPSSHRRWNDGKKDYHELLSDFIAPTRERMNRITGPGGGPSSR